MVLGNVRGGSWRFRLSVQAEGKGNVLQKNAGSAGICLTRGKKSAWKRGKTRHLKRAVPCQASHLTPPLLPCAPQAGGEQQLRLRAASQEQSRRTESTPVCPHKRVTFWGFLSLKQVSLKGEQDSTLPGVQKHLLRTLHLSCLI